MMRSRSRASDSEEPSEDAILEAELSRLQRGYRVMQNDYRAYKEETKRIINKQEQLVKGLESEQNEQHTVLSKLETEQNQNKDEENAQKLIELSGKETEISNAISDEKKQIKNLDSEIRKMERQISQQRKNMGGIHNSTATFFATGKNKAVLENRLDKAIVHFNKQLAVNKKLRDEIDHLRREHKVFENLYKRLQTELEKCKYEMSSVIDSATTAFEQRDEAHNKMAALNERNMKDQQQHDMEMKDLMRTIRNDDKVKEFMMVKANERQNYKNEEAIKRKKKGDESLDADNNLIMSYEKAFQRIQEVTGEKDINTIVENFIKNEDENFALFNYVNEVNSEVELFQEEVAAIRKDIEHFQQEDKQTDKRRRGLMKKLESKYIAVKKETDIADEKLTEVNKALDNMRGGIESIFKKIGCDPRPIKVMLGGELGVTNKNIMIYMGQIEQRTTELLNVLHYLKHKKSALEGSLIPKIEVQAKGPPTATDIAPVVPPSPWDDIGSDDEYDAEDVRPLTEEELRDKVRRTMERKMLNPMPTKSTTPNEPKKRRGKKHTP